MNESPSTQNGEAAKPKRIIAFLDNFWYHYKWHSIIALFLIFALTVCMLQMCQKESYDSYILYAGNYEIDRNGKNGDISDYETVTGMLERVAPDTNKDKKTSVSLKDLFVLTDEEMLEIENSDKETEVHYPLILENREILRDTMVYSNYYVTLLSPAVYEEYRTVDEIYMFTNLRTLNITSSDVIFYDDSAVLLSSTGFYKLPGICDLPQDTLVCLRNSSAFASHFNKDEAKQAYEAGVETVENIINYPK